MGRSRATSPPREPPPPTPPTHGRLAAIDIGSNSIHMLVVERGSAGTFRVLDREREMVRLGKSALGEGALSPKAMRRGL